MKQDIAIYTLLQKFKDEDIILQEKNNYYTKNDVLKKAKGIATFLTQQGISPDEHIGLLSSSGFEYISSFFGILLAQCVVVIIDPYFQDTVVKQQLHAAQVTHILCDKSVYRGSKYALTRWIIKKQNHIDLSFLGGFSKIQSNKMPISNTYISGKKYDKNKHCCFIPTGGTTGSPKIVQHTYKTFFGGLERLQQLDISGNTFLADLPYLGIVALLLGKKAFFVPTFKNIKTLLSIIKKHNIDILFLPPNKLSGTYRLPGNICTILLGSAPIYRSFLTGLHDRVQNNTKILGLYGMTECLPISRYNSKDKLRDKENDYLGTIFNDIGIKIENEELYIKTENACDGYVGQEKQKYITTGDIVKTKGEKLYMKGRKKNMIIKNGINIYPLLLNPIYSDLAGVEGGILFGVYNTLKNDELCILAIQIKEGYSQKDVLFSINSLPLHTEAPIDDIFFCTLPRAGRQSKINYPLLKQLYLAQKTGK